MESSPLSIVEELNNSDFHISKKIENTFTDELIIGICSPIGSLKKQVIDSIIKRLESDYKYEVEIIKVSDLILSHELIPFQNILKKTEDFSKLIHKIKNGDELRSKYGNTILAELVIKHIRLDRDEKVTTEIKGRRKCYIIDSLKNKEELNLLRTIYREIFYLFSVFSPKNERFDNLVNKNLAKKEVSDIIETDDFEKKIHGQDVRNTFIEADFFIRVSNNNVKKIDDKINRFFHLIFESNIITPNIHETAMFHAKSVAGNSACLSRQVGACITDEKGILLSQGWNDVPKFGGNLYSDTDFDSNRCFEKGYCTNSTYKLDIYSEIESEVNHYLKHNLSLNHFISKSLTDEISKIIQNSKFKDVIEYSRSIHAEMHALIIGSQMTGSKMINGNLYCTTYPCHNCARHIIVAGIKNVFYIEPYVKSLSLKLHNDAITENETDNNKVKILLYEGVAPRKYLHFFSLKNNRKDETGKKIIYNFATLKPKIRLSLQAIPTLENQILISLKSKNLLNEE